jgi:hypothetical protein
MSVVEPIATLPLSVLSDDENDLVQRMLAMLSAYETTNALKAAYYEGEQRVQMLNISIPPALQSLETVVGWPGTTVDVLEERLDWYGWTSDDENYGLDAVYSANHLDVDGSLVHLDALIYGTAFAVVGSGDADEPNPLITMHSPRGMTGLYSLRTRRLEAALSVITENGQWVEGTLYLPDETVVFRRASTGGRWLVEDRDRHNLGRVLVVQFVNRPRASRPGGRSEISRAVRYYTDAAVRTMLGMEVNREFYSAPQRYALGVDESSFVGPDGAPRTGWETVMGRVWAIDRDEDGNLPEVGQFTPSSPAPYLEQVKGLAQLIAAEATIPPSYLGFQTDNPASADAIQRSEARLVKRAERRQKVFGRSWLEVARLALLVRDGEVPGGFDALALNWRDAATPTRSAAADEATKLVGASILPADSQVTYDRIGLSPAEQRQVAADRRRTNGAAVLATLQAAAERVSGADRDAAP